MAVSLDAVEALEGRPVLITGAGWAVADVTVTVDHGPLASIVLTPATGDITSDGVIVWAPEVGTYELTADDGTDSISAVVKVWSNS